MGKNVSLTGAQGHQNPDAPGRLVQITCRIVKLLLELDVAW